MLKNLLLVFRRNLHRSSLIGLIQRTNQMLLSISHVAFDPHMDINLRSFSDDFTLRNVIPKAFNSSMFSVFVYFDKVILLSGQSNVDINKGPDLT